MLWVPQICALSNLGRRHNCTRLWRERPRLPREDPAVGPLESDAFARLGGNPLTNTRPRPLVPSMDPLDQGRRGPTMRINDQRDALARLVPPDEVAC